VITSDSKNFKPEYCTAPKYRNRLKRPVIT
jgi:hypothetical protein